MLALQDVTKKYGNQVALDEVNINIKEGEIVGLVGPNGSGKTTLMKILNGLIVNYEGEVVRNESIGALIESPKYFEHKSGLYNLKYFNDLFGTKQDVGKLLEQLNMDHYKKKSVKKYSMGMKQRLGIALALTAQPEYLILDEPTNGMDPSGVREVLRYLRRIAERNNIGMLISSHILSDIESLCDKVYLIHNGKIKKEHRPLVGFAVEDKDIGKIEHILLDMQDASITDNGIVKVPKSESKKVSQLFDEHGIEIKQIEEKSVSLEEMYFDMVEEDYK
ncbi:ABC transporter ATP-binding protein [Priestia endophytica]|nr:ABC transporter ATP-binding protein [Priestia endophytica]